MSEPVFSTISSQFGYKLNVIIIMVALSVSQILSAAATLSFLPGSLNYQRPKFLRSAYPQLGCRCCSFAGSCPMVRFGAAFRLFYGYLLIHSCNSAPAFGGRFSDYSCLCFSGYAILSSLGLMISALSFTGS